MTDEHYQYNNAASIATHVVYKTGLICSFTNGRKRGNCGGSHFVGAHIAVSFVLEVLSPPAHQRPTVGEQVELAQ
jgi:hypothetical protein